VELHCVVKAHAGEKSFARSVDRIWTAFDEGSLVSLLQVAGEELGPNAYGLDCVLPSSREEISTVIFSEIRERYAAQYEAMYQDARRAIAQFHDADLPLARELLLAAQLALGHRFDEEIARAPARMFEPTAYERAIEISEEAERYGCTLDRQAACCHFEGLLEGLMHRVCAGDTDESHAGSSPVTSALALLGTAERLHLGVDFDRAQELLHAALRAGLALSDPLRLLLEKLSLSKELLERPAPE